MHRPLSAGLVWGLLFATISGGSCLPDPTDFPVLPPFRTELQLDAVSPAYGPTAGNVTLYLDGDGFGPETRVLVDGAVTSQPLLVSSTRLGFILPENRRAFGKVPVVVQNPDGKRVSRSDLFSYFTAQLEFTRTRLETSSSPFTIIAADLDADRNTDLVVANAASREVSVFRSLPGGGFDTVKTVSNLAGLQSVVASDLDGDGINDLILGSSKGTMRLLWGNRSGLVLDPVERLISLSAADFATADFDGNGKLDIAAADRSTDTICILFDGASGSTTCYRIANDPLALVAQDWNGDGRADLAVLNSKYVGVSVLLNNNTETGSLGTPRLFPTGIDGRPSALVSGDFNGDRVPDLAVVNNGTSGVSGSDNIAVLFGDGAGGLLPVQTFAPGSMPIAAAAGDFDGNGRPDLAVVSASGTVRILLNGGGTFTEAAPVEAGEKPAQVAVLDIDHDGTLDLAVLNTGSGTVTLRYGDGHGGFRSTPLIFPTGKSPVAVAVADYDGDGKLDIASADAGSDGVSVILGTGTRRFLPAQRFAAGREPRGITARDLDRDGKPDLIVANAASNDVSVLNGDGHGSFAAARSFAAGAGPSAVTVSDVDGDGRPDLIVANAGSDDVSVLLGTEAGAFGSARQFGAGKTPRAVVALDLNGDLRPDLAVANFGSDDVSVLLNQGAGRFADEVRAAADLGPVGLDAADVNGDGYPDLVVANAASNNASILLGDGRGRFGERRQLSVSKSPGGVAVADETGNYGFTYNAAHAHARSAHLRRSARSAYDCHRGSSFRRPLRSGSVLTGANEHLYDVSPEFFSVPAQGVYESGVNLVQRKGRRTRGADLLV